MALNTCKSFSDSWLQPGVIVPPRGYLPVSGDIFEYHRWKVATASSVHRPWITLNIPQCTGYSPAAKDHVASNVNRDKFEKPSTS